MDGLSGNSQSKKCREDGAVQRWIGLRISLVNRLYVHLLFLELTIAIIILYYYMDCQRHIETTKSTEQSCQITYIHIIFILRLIIKFQGALQMDLNYILRYHLTLQKNKHKQEIYETAMLYHGKQM